MSKLLPLFEEYDSLATSIYDSDHNGAECARLRGQLVEALTKADAEAPRVEASLRRLMVFGAVNEERKRQDAQWGGPAHDDTHDALDWLDYIYHQTNKATMSQGADAQERFVKIAALAIAALESMGRKASKPVPPPAERLATLKREIADHLDEDKKGGAA